MLKKKVSEIMDEDPKKILKRVYETVLAKQAEFQKISADLKMLVEYFISKLSQKLGKHVDRISQATLTTLKNYHWPGNVRELENVIERAMVVSLGSELRLVDDLQSPMEQPVVSYTEQTLAEVERKHITQTLEKVNWRIEGDAGAAKILGMHPVPYVTGF